MEEAGVEVGGLFKGFWRYLLARLEARAELDRERERNRLYADHRDQLPDNCELLDGEGCQGRFLWIRKGPPATGEDRQCPPVLILAVEAAAQARNNIRRRLEGGMTDDR